jgi:hypothetical protein
MSEANEAGFASLPPGEVLVCPTASASWTILFGIAGALVTDGGGPLAHAAIVGHDPSERLRVAPSGVAAVSPAVPSR